MPSKTHLAKMVTPPLNCTGQNFVSRRVPIWRSLCDESVLRACQFKYFVRWLASAVPTRPFRRRILKKTDKAACYDKSSAQVVIQIKVLHSRVLHTLNERVQASLEHANYNGGMKIRPIEISITVCHRYIRLKFLLAAMPNPTKTLKPK